MSADHYDPDGIRYRCLAGHDITANELDQSTELQILDAGARVRLCREHGAPIAVEARDTRGEPDLRL
jgi:hypothetical protein